jgi:hypothetical protein
VPAISWPAWHSAISTIDYYQSNFATVAYDAATGAVAWSAVDQLQAVESAASVAVSPTDGTVFVAGTWTFIAPDYGAYSYYTIAYSG